MPEWDGPAIVLSAKPFGEHDAIVALISGDEGLRRGLVKGARSRSKQAIWQPGNILQARWVGRLDDQLGQFTGELTHPAAAIAMRDAISLMVLSSFCAVAESALPPQTAHPNSFVAAARLVAEIESEASIAPYIRWEATLLQELGYGFDLSCCAVTGERFDLAYVSPKTGRAVTEKAAGLWKDRLLKIPPFLLADVQSVATDWCDGLRLTGFFLERDAFGQLHHGPPDARNRLFDYVSRRSAAS